MTMYETLLFPHAQIKRLIIDAGIERVSNDAVQELEKILFIHGELVSKEAMFIANKNKRSTVREEDIELAISNVIVRM
jgi:histone H3/H4